MGANSTAAWYRLDAAEPSNVEVFVDETAQAETITLTGDYVDLQRTPVSGSLELPPYSSRVLVAE